MSDTQHFLCQIRLRAELSEPGEWETVMGGSRKSADAWRRQVAPLKRRQGYETRVIDADADVPPAGATHTIAPWTFKFNGARLADVFHATRPGNAVDCIDCGYDWETGKSNATRASFEADCAQWVADHGADAEEDTLPYL